MAQYREGTVTVTASSSTVTGTGTRWLASVEPGHYFSIRDQGITYSVAAVVSDTHLVLTGAYQGSTAAGQFYYIHTDYTPRGFAVPGPGDIDAALIIRRAIFEIDADLTSALGSADGSARSVRVRDIVDLNSTTALSGQVFTKLPDGSYGFTEPGALSTPMVNMTTAATNLGLVYAGSATNGNHQFRAIQVVGGTLVQNSDRLTITIPSSGQTNSLASIGSATSQSIVAAPTGTTLNVYGVRAGSNMTIIRDGNDLLFSSTATGGGGTVTGGEANVGENIGSGTTNVVRVYSDKSGLSLRFRSLLFDVNHFTVTGEATGQYSVASKRPRLSELTGVDLASAVTGHVPTLASDGVWRSQAVPSPGIPAVASDTQPRLGGNLNTNGNRIIGIAGTLSGMVERPKSKNYTLVLKTNTPITITSMAAACGAGSVQFGIFLGATLPDTPGGVTSAPINGTVPTGGFVEVIPTTPLQVPAGSRLTMVLNPVTVSPTDFSFSVAHASA